MEEASPLTAVKVYTRFLLPFRFDRTMFRQVRDATANRSADGLTIWHPRQPGGAYFEDYLQGFSESFFNSGTAPAPPGITSP